jgi:acyl carrier protein
LQSDSEIRKDDNLMTKQEFLRLLEGQLEVGEGSLNENQALADLEGWDSMAAVLFIALADERLGVSVVGNQIARAKTINDLLSLLGTGLIS